MTPILDCVGGHLKGPLGTVLHVGTGLGMVVDAYSAFGCERMVLVEGDADALHELRSQAARVAAAEIVAAVASPTDGVATWHRCSVSSLNGLADPTVLRHLYPRLCVTSTESVPTQSIASLVNAHVAAGTQAFPNLLVLDTPGLEDSLLSALPDSLLARFQWILVRHWPSFVRPDESTSQPMGERLAAMNYRIVHATGNTQTAWRATLLHFEVSPVQLQHLNSTCHTQSVRLDALLAEVESLIVERNTLREAGAAKEVEAQTIQAALAATLESHDDEERRLADDIQHKVAQISALEQQADELRLASAAQAKDALGLKRLLDESLAAREETEALQKEQMARSAIHSEEMIRAEAQLEIIKDLLLRGPRL